VQPGHAFAGEPDIVASADAAAGMPNYQQLSLIQSQADSSGLWLALTDLTINTCLIARTRSLALATREPI